MARATVSTLSKINHLVDFSGVWVLVSGDMITKHPPPATFLATILATEKDDDVDKEAQCDHVENDPDQEDDWAFH